MDTHGTGSTAGADDPEREAAGFGGASRLKPHLEHVPRASQRTGAIAERAGGVPLLTDARATIECEIVAEHPTGDHWIVVAQVNNLHISPIKDPLIFYAGAYRALR